ncbi:MAG: hypothetical protein HFF90_00460 [Oscillibacter sp.]|nr:hypothetical protein [Oscillibacter sp.]
MQIFIAAAPEAAKEAMAFRRPLAHAAYRIGPDSTLLRQSLLLQAKGGLLCVSDHEAPAIEDPEALCAAVLRECSRRGYGGAVLDFEEPPTPDRVQFASRLGASLTASRKTLYLPETYCQASKNAILLICTAISGGSFTQRLEEAASRHGGAARLALDVQRLRMAFPLPARTAEGDPLTQEALQALLTQHTPSVFFSQDLCARYFTYATDSQTHFVLYDDADTLRQKLRLGSGMGFHAAFLMWPEIRDIAPQLL